MDSPKTMLLEHAREILRKDGWEAELYYGQEPRLAVSAPDNPTGFVILIKDDTMLAKSLPGEWLRYVRHNKGIPSSKLTISDKTTTAQVGKWISSFKQRHLKFVNKLSERHGAYDSRELSIDQLREAIKPASQGSVVKHDQMYYDLYGNQPRWYLTGVIAAPNKVTLALTVDADLAIRIAGLLGENGG